MILTSGGGFAEKVGAGNFCAHIDGALTGTKDYA